MANKRITELTALASPDVSDLLLVSDVSEMESTKLTIGLLGDFYKNIINSGSFHGTSSWSNTASYAMNAIAQDTASYSYTSSWAVNIATASYSNNSLTASYVNSSSYSLTASYAMTYEQFASSAYAAYARTASYLQYIGIPNGTASYAINSLTASYTSGTASYSFTSSHALYAVYSVNGRNSDYSTYSVTSSWASKSLSSSYSDISDTSRQSSYLIYTGVDNGIVSTAITALNLPSFKRNHGIYSAITQSSTLAQLDNVNAISQNTTDVEANGAIYIPFTTTPDTASIELIALNRWSGITSSLDKCPLNAIASAAVGGLTIPFNLIGSALLSGSYILYVTSSLSEINQVRPVKFKISNDNSTLIVSVDEETKFKIVPTSSLIYYTSSIDPSNGRSGSYIDLNSDGLDTITDFDITNAGVSTIKYLWSMPNLKYVKTTYNYELTDIGGLPNSIVTMSINNCSLNILAPLQYTSASILNCSINKLSSLPVLSQTMSYINCSTNYITSLPWPLPYGLTTIIADSNLISTPPTSFPSTVISMSLANNSVLSTWYYPFPTSLQYLDLNNTILTSIPTLPSGISYIDVHTCQMTAIALENITSNLVLNGLSNGYANISGNPASYTATTLANISTLTTTKGWTVIS